MVGLTPLRIAPSTVAAGIGLMSLQFAASAAPVSAQEDAGAESVEPPAAETSTPDPETSVPEPENATEEKWPSAVEEEEEEAQDSRTCLSDPWAASEVSADESYLLASSAGGECLSPVARMTGDATLFGKRPGWSPGRIAVAQHASGYYLRLTYKVPDEWSRYRVKSGDPLILGLEDGTELAFFPVCGSQASSGVFTGYFHARQEQLQQLSVQGVTYARQLMTTPADAESEYLERTYGGLSYFVLRSAEEPFTTSLQRLAQCMLQATEADAASIVVARTTDSTEPAEKGAYSKKVQGKLWLEGFVGPTSYNPDRFGIRYDDDFGGGHIGGELGIPRVIAPEFGGAIGGALADQVIFIAATYRQANYREPTGGSFKMMKVGVDLQLAATKVPYLHPLVRFGGGYARYFGGDFSTLGLKTNGFYFNAGAGVRIPIVRWVSIFGIFDWNFVSVTPSGNEGPNDLNVFISGSQLGGTFGLTLHFVRVK